MSFILMAPQIFYWCINDISESKEKILLEVHETGRIVKVMLNAGTYLNAFLIYISIALLKGFLPWKKIKLHKL